MFTFYWENPSSLCRSQNIQVFSPAEKMASPGEKPGTTRVKSLLGEFLLEGWMSVVFPPPHLTPQAGDQEKWSWGERLPAFLRLVSPQFWEDTKEGVVERRSQLGEKPDWGKLLWVLLLAMLAFKSAEWWGCGEGSTREGSNEALPPSLTQARKVPILEKGLGALSHCSLPFLNHFRRGEEQPSLLPASSPSQESQREGSSFSTLFSRAWSGASAGSLFPPLTPQEPGGVEQALLPLPSPDQALGGSKNIYM